MVDDQTGVHGEEIMINDDREPWFLQRHNSRSSSSSDTIAASEQFEDSVIEEIIAKTYVFGEDDIGFSDNAKAKIFTASTMNHGNMVNAHPLVIIF